MIRRGVYIEFDLFGHIPLNPAPPDYPFTVEKSVLKHLADEGYGDRVLLSQDVYQKPFYRGEAGCVPDRSGYGYAHLLRDFIPKLTTGTDAISQAAADLMTTENPKRLLPVQVGKPVQLSEWTGGAGCAGKVENSVVRPGIPEGSVRTDAPDRHGTAKAFQFDRATADAIRVPHNGVFNSTHPFSVSLWFKAGAQPSPSTHVCLLDKSHGAWLPNSDIWYERRDTGWAFQLTPQGILQFALGTGSGFSIVTTAASVLNTSTLWQHVAGVYTGSEILIFLNGLREGRLTLDQVPLGNGGDLYVGRAWAGGNPQRHYTGLMDDVRFFSGALSENAVLSLYRRGLPQEA